ncbi:hypothetical protein GR268_45120, partial [Rhizobium leguminosarum]|nr:hypothetical protein [Rhizobium leguminosarum]
SITHSELPLRLRVVAAPLVLGGALTVVSNPDDECAFFSLPGLCLVVAGAGAGTAGSELAADGAMMEDLGRDRTEERSSSSGDEANWGMLPRDARLPRWEEGEEAMSGTAGLVAGDREDEEEDEEEALSPSWSKAD